MERGLAEFKWRKSSRSNASGHCVEIGFPVSVWRKSSASNATGQCVEVALAPDVAAVRDSKNPAGGALLLSPHAWEAFRTAVRR